MIKPFAALVVFWVLMLFFIGLHYLSFPYKKSINTLQSMTALTQMTSLSLSVNYDESSYNGTYPEMQAMGRTGFIYEP